MTTGHRRDGRVDTVGKRPSDACQCDPSVSKSLVTLAFLVHLSLRTVFAFGGNTDDTTRAWLKSFRRSCLRPQARISS